MIRELLTGLAIGAVLTTQAMAETKWDVPSDMTPRSPAVATLRSFADEVAAATNGQLKIVVHANGSLFKSTEIKRAVQVSQISIGEMPMGLLENENAIFGVGSVPFLADSFEKAWKLWESERPIIDEILASQGLKVLYALPSPPQGIFSKVEIKTGKELAGTKWRAYDPTTSAIGTELGAQPVTILLSELSQALSVGMVDAFPTAARVGSDLKVFESVKYFYPLNFAFPKRFVIVNRKDLDALDESTKQALCGVRPSRYRLFWSSRHSIFWIGSLVSASRGWTR